MRTNQPGSKTAMVHNPVPEDVRSRDREDWGYNPDKFQKVLISHDGFQRLSASSEQPRDVTTKSAWWFSLTRGVESGRSLREPDNPPAVRRTCTGHPVWIVRILPQEEVKYSTTSSTGAGNCLPQIPPVGDTLWSAANSMGNTRKSFSGRSFPNMAMRI